MRILLEVIDELYSFAVNSVLYLFGREGKRSPGSDIVYALEAPVTRPAIELAAPEEESEASSFRSVGLLLNNEAPKTFGIEKNTVMYVGTNETAMYAQATQEFDTCTGTLRYGDMVMVLAQKGRWANIAHNAETGWVLREDLVDRAAYVYPEFVIGKENGPDDPNTVRVRAILDDIFEGARVEFPLQAGEYVLYRLKRKGLTITWPQARPRTPGRWHTILKAVSGIHMSIVPKTGSVMEWVWNDEIGHLAYVEAVFPDETIHLSEANYPDRGIYNERIMTREEWRELRPVFIQVS